MIEGRKGERKIKRKKEEACKKRQEEKGEIKADWIERKKR